MKLILTIFGIGASAIAGIFALSYLGYMGTAFFAPLYEGVRRDTMIESRAFSEASVRRLQVSIDLMARRKVAQRLLQSSQNPTGFTCQTAHQQRGLFALVPKARS
jgi:hypothetical protein